MVCQSLLLPVSWMSLLLDIDPLVVKVLRLLTYDVLGLPLPRLPVILPQRISLSIPSFLKMCPKNFNCRFLMVFMSEHSVPACCSTSILVFLSFQDILRILLRNHISVAFSFLSISSVIVQHSHPYNRTDHTYAFRVLSLVSMVMFLFF